MKGPLERWIQGRTRWTETEFAPRFYCLLVITSLKEEFKFTLNFDSYLLLVKQFVYCIVVFRAQVLWSL